MAFFDIPGDHPFTVDIMAVGNLRAIIQAGSEYTYTNLVSIFDTRKDPNGINLHVIGLNGSDFHLIEAMKHADYLYVVYTEEWAQRLYERKRDDYALRYSLKGSSHAIAQILNCAGYEN